MQGAALQPAADNAHGLFSARLARPRRPAASLPPEGLPREGRSPDGRSPKGLWPEGRPPKDFASGALAEGLPPTKRSKLLPGARGRSPSLLGARRIPCADRADAHRCRPLPRRPLQTRRSPRRRPGVAVSLRRRGSFGRAGRAGRSSERGPLCVRRRRAFRAHRSSRALRESAALRSGGASARRAVLTRSTATFARCGPRWRRVRCGVADPFPP